VSEILSLTQVSLRRAGRPLLHDVTWTVWSGQHWAMLGPNGAGKTSLLNIIMGYQWPSSGQVEVLGRRFGHADLREMRTEVGWVSASLADWLSSHHGGDTVLEVVAGGKFASIGLYRELSPELAKAALQALELFSLTDRAVSPFVSLSQGERQRVMLARAWLAEPRLLVLDEPCSGLDLPGREALLKTLQRLMTLDDGPTLLYVTHHPEEVVPAVTHVLLLRQGQVLVQGPKTECLTAENLSQLFGLAVSISWHGGRPWLVTGTGDDPAPPA